MQRRSEHEISIHRFTFQHWATDVPIQASFSGKASCPSGHFTSGKHSTHNKAKIQQRRPRTVDQLENGTKVQQLVSKVPRNLCTIVKRRVINMGLSQILWNVLLPSINLFFFGGGVKMVAFLNLTAVLSYIFYYSFMRFPN